MASAFVPVFNNLEVGATFGLALTLSYSSVEAVVRGFPPPNPPFFQTLQEFY